MSNKAEDIIKKAEQNGGLIKTSDIQELGSNRTYIRELVEAGLLVRESHGIYSVKGESPDEYSVIQKRSSKLIFSYGTALFFQRLSDRVPRYIDVTVPQGYNVSRIKKSFDNLRFHYVKPDVLMEGVEKVITPQGFEVNAYNKERCICDLIKADDNVDKQIYTQALQDYFANYSKPRELIKMAKIIGVEQSARRYMEVLQR